MSLSLAACGRLSTRPAVEFRYVDDLPDASLVTPCDTAETNVERNGDMLAELTRTRRQRDDCAGQVNSLGEWRKDAAARTAERNKR